jgi:aspartate kinase
VTDAQHGAAVPDRAATDERLRALVRPLLADGVVPVTGGFVGATTAGLATTLGRGGSDYSAALFGAGLPADEIQIWTDVDGMLTADPRLVAGPRVVSCLSFDEASELAYFGAKVLHPSTILPAVGRGIPVRILNSHRPEAPGTLVTRSAEGGGEGPAAIACKRGLTRIDITSSRMLMAYGFLRRVFEVFERFRTPVDVVTTSEVCVSVTIDDRRELAGILAELSTFADVASEDGMAIVCAVGERLRTDARLATRVLGALEGLPLAMVSQGGSRKNITVVLRDADAPAAMERLHRRFFEGGSAASGRETLATA